MINQVGANFAQEMRSYYAARVAFERIVVDSDKPRYVQNDLNPHVTILDKLVTECQLAEELCKKVQKYGVLGEILERYYEACKELYHYQDEDDPNMLHTITKMHDAEDDLARFGYPLSYGFETYCHMMRK